MDKKRTHSRVSNGIFTPSSLRNRTLTARFIRLFKMPRPIGKPVFANCLDEHVNHRLRLFCVLQFLHLVYPFASSGFSGYQHYYGTSAPAVVCEALLQLTGAPLAALYSMPVCTFWPAVLQTDLPNAGINHSGFSSSKPHPACGHLLQRRRTADKV